MRQTSMGWEGAPLHNHISPISESDLSTKQTRITGSPSASHREGKCQREALVSCKHPGWSADYSRDLEEREISLGPGTAAWLSEMDQIMR